MSREHTTKWEERNLMNRSEKRELPDIFREWLKNPVEDWDMPTRLVMSL